MKNLKGNIRGMANFCMYLIGLIIVTMLFAFTSCTKRPATYSVLEFTGEDAVLNYSKSFLYFSSDSAGKKSLLAKKGDIIMYGNNKFYYYQDTPICRFSISVSKEADSVNGRINSIDIPGNEDLIPWLKQTSFRDHTAPEFLNFTSANQEIYFPYLIDLAKVKPDIGLSYGGELSEMNKLFGVFNPRFIIGAEFSQEDFKLLKGLTNLEILMVSYDDSVNTIPLPAIPRLRELLLVINKEIKLCDEFFCNNKQIESLSLKFENNGKFDLSCLNYLNNLKELKIFGLDSLENFDLINKQSNLELLSVNNAGIYPFSALDNLKNIRWISFSPKITQVEFNSFVLHHQDLEILEIFNNKNVTSLKALAKLRRFYGLVVTDTLTDLASVKSLDNLKYLSLPEIVVKDSLKINELRNSLPNCKIVANEGFCLGSGWLLLIIPMILFFLFVFRQKTGKYNDVA